jgi:hypothetical protein
MGQNEMRLMMSYFIDVEGLIGLEKQEKWEEARTLLYNLWESDKLNSDKLIRLLSECWYVLSLWDCCIDTENLSYQTFKDTLVKCVEYGLLKFNDNPRFLCMAGYMSSILPYLFYEGNTESLYVEWEQKGKEMLNLSTVLNGDDLISNMLSLGAKSATSEYFESVNKLLPMLNNIFPNETAIELYFRDVLTPKN